MAFCRAGVLTHSPTVPHLGPLAMVNVLRVLSASAPLTEPSYHLRADWDRFELVLSPE